MKRQNSTDSNLPAQEPSPRKRQFNRPGDVACEIPFGWTEAKDQKEVASRIDQPDKDETWHEHCEQHIITQFERLNETLNLAISAFWQGDGWRNELLVALPPTNKVAMLRNLCLRDAEKLAAQRAQTVVDYLQQLNEALDRLGRALTLVEQVMVHFALHGQDTWLVEMVRAGDWLGTGHSELYDALTDSQRKHYRHEVVGAEQPETE
jgi:hypothetical protein